MRPYRLTFRAPWESPPGVRASGGWYKVPVDRWYEIIGNPTIADAVLDRLVHNAHRIELTGESLRKRRPSQSQASAA